MSTPLHRYARLLRSLPDTPVPNPHQPVMVALSEQLGAPTGLSVNAQGLLDWAVDAGGLTASTLWKVRETFRGWEARKPTRHEVAGLLEWLADNV